MITSPRVSFDQFVVAGLGERVTLEHKCDDVTKGMISLLLLDRKKKRHWSTRVMTSPRVWFDQFVVVTNKCFTVGNDSFSAGVFLCVGLMAINWGKIKKVYVFLLCKYIRIV